MMDLTDEERNIRNQDIVRLYVAGMTQRQLAEKFGLSISGVFKVLNKAGARLPDVEKDRRRRSFPRGPGITWTPDMHRALIMARVNGAPIQKCADVVGVGYTLAWRKLAQFGLANEVKAA